MTDTPLFSVSEYITLLNEQLKQYEAKIVGEITQMKIGPTGHVYFALKDKAGGAVMDCILWSRTYQMYGIKLTSGMEVVLSGKATIYAPYGKLSFVAQSISLVGEGALKKAYEEVKKKLESEGLFAKERKRVLPAFPKRIGIITSRQGAVIHDFLQNSGRYGLSFTFIDTRVEGQDALPSLLSAVRRMEKVELDVLVIMRGGGSLESLVAFDNERLVRSIASFPVPVIAAIGHHMDMPLVSFAADVSVSTPTAAANLLNESWDEGSYLLHEHEQKILYTFTSMVREAGVLLEKRKTGIVERFERILGIFTYTSSHFPQYLAKLKNEIHHVAEHIDRQAVHVITHMADAISENGKLIETLGSQRVYHSFSSAAKSEGEKIQSLEKLINAHSPLRLLSLGYSLVQKSTGELVKSFKDVRIGESISVLLSDGGVKGEITEIMKGENHE